MPGGPLQGHEPTVQPHGSGVACVKPDYGRFRQEGGLPLHTRCNVSQTHRSASEREGPSKVEFRLYLQLAYVKVPDLRQSRGVK